MILSAGRLSAQKDFPTLIRAFAALRATRDARLVILGGATADGKTEVRQQDLVALAEGLGVASDLCLLGFMPNPYAYMARARIFALSSAWEGFGNVLVEALACGCPVVSTDCPHGPAEILDGGRYGRLVPVGDDAAMAEAMADVLVSPPDPALLRQTERGVHRRTLGGRLPRRPVRRGLTRCATTMPPTPPRESRSCCPT